MPPVKVYWYEGSMADNFTAPEPLTQEDVRSYNEIFIGTKAYIGTGGRGESVGVIRQSITERPPELIQRSPGHFEDFIQAVKGEQQEACSNFSIAGPYAEWMLLGAISWRFPNEKLEWDGENLRFTNNEKANEYVKPYMRTGWELDDITV